MPRVYSKTLAAALALHDRGFWVVPCAGKKAVVKDWPNTRVERDELIAILQRDPTLSIAIVISKSPLIDVECDSEQAEEELMKLLGGDIPPTPTWSSTRGKHRLFLRPEGLPASAKAHLGEIEFRLGNGKGALSVVPPSEGREWLPGLSLDDVEPAELPEHIAELLRQPPSAPVEAPTADRIAEGKRNDTLFQKACALNALKLPLNVMLETLASLNRTLCNPPLPDSEVREIAMSAAKNEPKVGLLEQLLAKAELWHDPTGEPYATIQLGEHRENLRIGKRQRQFRRWLSKLIYDLTKAPLSDSELSETAALLEGRACFDGPEYPVWRRTAELDGKYYIDLCDDLWRAIEVDADGWRLVPEPPVKFIRARAMLPLPVPERPREGETLNTLLRPFLNVRDSQFPLLAAWLVAGLRPRGPFPMLKLLGGQGTGKTTKARICRKLLDPNSAPVRAEPRSTRDLMIAANNAWVLCLDNLSTIKPELSDALCRLATGGGFATRTLYCDDDETIFDAQRPVISTSIEDIGNRSDLLERSLIIELPTIDESHRRTERELWAAFDRDHPRILGALLDVLSAAIARLPEIEGRENVDLCRLADFEQFGIAAERALGLADGVFAEAYAANRADAQLIALEASPVVAALLKMVDHQGGSIEMTATELLKKLLAYHHDTRTPPGWPRTARVLSAILRRVAANLRHIGVTAEVTKVGNDKKWSIINTQYAKPQGTQKSRPVPKPTPPGENPYRLLRKGGA